MASAFGVQEQHQGICLKVREALPGSSDAPLAYRTMLSSSQKALAPSHRRHRDLTPKGTL